MIVERGDTLRFGRHVGVSFHRTVRVYNQDTAFPLPPGFGRFPITEFQAEAEAGRGGMTVALPMRPFEAVWIGFDVSFWHPHALMIGIAGVNAVTGEVWTGQLNRPQNYVVSPPQLWLDGALTRQGQVRQFVAVGTGKGKSVGEQVATMRMEAALQIRIVPPKPGLFPDDPPPPSGARPAQAMALGLGGLIWQKIYPDPYPLDTWDLAASENATVCLIDVETFTRICRQEVPPSPIDAQTYARLGLPWYELDDEEEPSLPPTDVFDRMSPVENDKDSSIDPSELRLSRIERRNESGSKKLKGE